MKKKVLAFLLVFCMVIGFAPAAFAAEFTDTEGHWAETSIDRWADDGIITGMGGNVFDPSGTMTRAQAAAMFARLLKLEAKADISSFEDVDSDAWYAEYIAMCVAAGLMNGLGNNTMDPDGLLTREQMMVMLCRALGIEPAATCEKEFSDADEISDWAEGYINALVNEGIVDGIGGNTMAPNADIDRASTMALLDKSIAGYADEDGETLTVPEGKTGVVLVVADNVKVEDAPAGTIVVTGAETTGATVNGTEVDKDTVHEVPEEEEPVTPPVVVPSTPSHSHSYTASYTSLDNGTHTAACSCGATTTEDCGDWVEGAVCEKCGYNRNAEAKIGDEYFDTLAAAIGTATSGQTIVLLKDITMGVTDAVANCSIAITQAITLDGNGKTLTSTAGRAINVSTANGVTIKNLSISASGERGINVINGATNVTIDNVTIVAANYAVNAASSAANTIITVKDSDLTGLNVVNIGAAGAQVTVTNTKLTCNDQNANENYSAIALNEYAAGAQATVTGGSITVKDDSTAGSIQGADARIAISETTEIDGDETIDEHVAIIDYNNGYWYGFTTLDAAIAKAEAGETVKLIRDIDVSETIVIDKNITLDGNGRTITADVDLANDGTNNVILTSGGTIKNLTIVGGHRGIRADKLTSSLVVDNVEILSSVRPIHVHDAVKESEINVNVSNSKLAGKPSVDEDVDLATWTNCEFQINDGIKGNVIDLRPNTTFDTCTFAEGFGFSHDDIRNNHLTAVIIYTDCIITIAGEYDEYNITYAYIDGEPAEAIIGTTPYATLAEAVEDATSGQTITLLAYVTVDAMIEVDGKSITLDLNGYTIEAADDLDYVLWITVGDSVIINDTTGYGGIVNENDLGYAILNQGTVTINGGIFTGDAALWNGYNTINAVATLNGGAFFCRAGSDYGVSIGNQGTLVVNNAAVDIHDWVQTYGAMTVNACSIEGLMVLSADAGYLP